MRFNRWLIIIISIIIFISIALFVLIKYVKIDRVIIEYVRKTLEKSMDCDFSMGYYSMGDRQFFATDIELYDKEKLYRIYIEKIQIEYNLLYLLFIKNQPTQLVSSIRIYNPVVDLMILSDEDTPEPPSTAKNDVDFLVDLTSLYYPDTYIYFSKIDVYNGSFNMIIDLKQFKFEKHIKNIDISIENKDYHTTALVSVNDGENATLNIEISKPIGLPPSLDMNLTSATITDMSIPDVGYIYSNAYMQMHYENELELLIMLTDTSMTFTQEDMSGMIAKVDTLMITGSESFLTLLTFPITIKNGEKYSLQTLQTTLTASVSNPLDAKKTEFMSQVRVEDITIPSDLINSDNKLDIQIMSEGNYQAISARARVNADLLQLSLPVSDSLTIKEDLRGVSINITNENVLQEHFDIRADINQVLGTKINLNGKFDPYHKTGNIALFTDDLTYAFRTIQKRSVSPTTSQIESPRQSREGSPSDGQRRGQRGSRNTPRNETPEPTSQTIENFIKASLVTNIDFEIKDSIFYLKPSDLQIKNIDVRYLNYALNGNYIILKTNMQFDMSKPIIQTNRKNPLQIEALVEISYDLYDEALQGAVVVDLAKWDTSFQTNLNRLNLTTINPTLPPYLINSDISGKYNNYEIDLSLSTTAGNLLIKDYYFVADLGINYHKIDDILDLKLNLKDSFINYTPLTAQIEASGSKSSVRSQTFHLNERIFGDVYLEIPKYITMLLDETWLSRDTIHGVRPDTINAVRTDTLKNTLNLPTMDIHLWGNDLSISQLAQYAMNYTDASMLSGILSFALDYDNLNNPADPLSAHFTAYDILFDPIEPFTIDFQCNGDIDRINIDKMSVVMDSLQILSATALVNDLGKSINAQADFYADLKNIQKAYDVSGTISGSAVFRQNNDDATAHLKLDTQTIYYQGKPLLRTSLDITQLTDKLQVNNAEIFIGREFVTDTPKRQKKNAPPPTPRAVPPLMYANIFGALNYNLITDTLYPITDSLHISANGDPIAAIQNFTPFITGGSSNFFMNGSVILAEDGLQFIKGELEINNAHASILTQTETVRNINIVAEIVDNVLNIYDFRFSLGKGTLYILNTITNTNEDILISNVNFGKFFIYTDRTGLQIHAPGFMPAGNTAYLIVRGRRSQQASISGPLDDMHISAEVELYNANIIFPEKTDNILKMFDFVRSEIRSSSQTTAPELLDLPFTLDLMALLSRNNRYVTYPMDLRLKEDCYAHVTFDGNQFIIQEVSITAEEGNLELFGTFLDLDTAELMLSRFEDVPNLNASFYRKIADGSTITLNIFTDRVGGAKIMDRLKFELKSDNADDNNSIFAILAKLRYGKTFDELDETGTGNLVKEETIQILGVSVASAFLNQYLAPIENRVRRVLRLDNMNINPGFVQNMVNQKVWEDFALNESSIFNTNLLLNNMQIQMGRYVNRNVYLEYELNFQEGSGLTNNTNILLYHTLGLRYDLPYQLKVRYSYELKPKFEQNAHEIFLMRSFKF